MQKHDKMVALAKEKSAEMTETAITAIETMYRKNIKISVAELTKLTGLSGRSNPSRRKEVCSRHGLCSESYRTPRGKG